MPSFGNAIPTFVISDSTTFVFHSHQSEVDDFDRSMSKIYLMRLSSGTPGDLVNGTGTCNCNQRSKVLAGSYGWLLPSALIRMTRFDLPGTPRVVHALSGGKDTGNLDRRQSRLRAVKNLSRVLSDWCLPLLYLNETGLVP